jgi:hypothetical protein
MRQHYPTVERVVLDELRRRTIEGAADWLRAHPKTTAAAAAAALLADEGFMHRTRPWVIRAELADRQLKVRADWTEDIARLMNAANLDEPMRDSLLEFLDDRIAKDCASEHPLSPKAREAEIRDFIGAGLWHVAQHGQLPVPADQVHEWFSERMLAALVASRPDWREVVDYERGFIADAAIEFEAMDREFRATHRNEWRARIQRESADKFIGRLVLEMNQ